MIEVVKTEYKGLKRKRSLMPRKAPKRPLGAIKKRKVGKVASKKKKAPTVSKLKKELWELCKQIVRKIYGLPDGTWVCYTCDLPISNPKDAHTAHFVARSLSGVELRYSLRNLRVCCGNCNVWKSGNWPAYYERMVKEVGIDEVNEIIASRNNFTKATRTLFEEKIAEYQALLSSL